MDDVLSVDLNQNTRVPVEQVVPAITATPSTAMLGAGDTIHVTTGALTGLTASTSYSYSVTRGDSTANTNCAALATTDSAGTLPSTTVTVSYATASASYGYTGYINVYDAAYCPPGAPFTDFRPQTARGTYSVQVWPTHHA